MSNQKSRATPRVSCTKLGEYMVSSPTRRRRIVQDQKWPSDFIAPRYTDAQEVIGGFIRRGGNDISIIENAIGRLLRAHATSDWQRQRNQLCIDALKSFMNISPDLDLRPYTVRQTGNRQPKLNLGGVEVSVRPELIFRVARKGKPQSSGLIKLYFSKGNPLSLDATKYVGVMLHEFAYEFLPPLKTAAPLDCFLVDVFAENIHVAPRSTKRLRNELVDGCVEIAAVWASIQEPKEQVKYRTHNQRATNPSARA